MLPEEVSELLYRAEAFGHAYGVLAVVISVVVLDTARRRLAWRLLAASLGAGLLADAIKLTVPRLRPDAFDLGRPVWESFLGWSLWLEQGWRGVLRSHQQSCPSAHTAAAVGLAMGLAWIYPRGRWWFFTLAVLCGMSRIESGAHFPSDVLWGTAVGAVMGAAFFRGDAAGVEGTGRPLPTLRVRRRGIERQRHDRSSPCPAGRP